MKTYIVCYHDNNLDLSTQYIFKGENILDAVAEACSPDNLYRVKMENRFSEIEISTVSETNLRTL